MISIRNKIRKNIAAFIMERHSVDSGTQSNTFRKAFTTPWKPEEKMRPSFHVEDDGASRDGSSASETEKGFEARMLIVLNLKDDYSRTANYERVVKVVEDIILNLQNRCSIGPGVFRVNYVSDDPLRVQLSKGAAEHIWTIQFEVKWSAQVPDLNN